MPLALQLLTRPARVAGLVLLAGAVALVSAALMSTSSTLGRLNVSKYPVSIGGRFCP